MPSSLMDLETGDVYIDTDTGLLVTVDDETAVQQIIYMLFKTRPKFRSIKYLLRI